MRGRNSVQGGSGIGHRHDAAGYEYVGKSTIAQLTPTGTEITFNADRKFDWFIRANQSRQIHRLQPSVTLTLIGEAVGERIKPAAHMWGWIRLFADAEVPEDGVEQVLDADLPGDAADRAQRQAQIFGAQLRQVGIAGAGQAGGSFL